MGNIHSPTNIVCLADMPADNSADRGKGVKLFYNSPYSSVQALCGYYKELYDESALPRLKLFEEATTMRRGNKFLEQCGNFMDDIEGETLRSYTHAVTKTGRLEITPIQALHLPDPTRNVYVKFTYGDASQSTNSAPPTAYPVRFHRKIRCFFKQKTVSVYNVVCPAVEREIFNNL